MPLPPSQVVGTLFVDGLFYGLYLSTLFNCIRWLVFTDEGWKVRKRISWVLLSITIALFMLSTTSKTLDIQDDMSQVINSSKPEPYLPPPGSVFQAKVTALPWMTVVKVSLLITEA